MIGKLYNRVINNSLLKYRYLELNDKLYKGQSGFRMGRSCTDISLSFNELILGHTRVTQGHRKMFCSRGPRYAKSLKSSLIVIRLHSPPTVHKKTMHFRRLLTVILSVRLFMVLHYNVMMCTWSEHCFYNFLCVTFYLLSTCV